MDGGRSMRAVKGNLGHSPKTTVGDQKALARATGTFGRSIAKQSEGWAGEKSARSGRSISTQMDGAMP